MEEECIFCKIAKGEVPSEKVYENDNFLAILDINKAVEGHTLVIPKKHYTTTLDMPSSLGTELLDAIKKSAVILMDKHKAEGFNVLNNNFDAGLQFVKHVHYHILPRKKGDNVKQLY